MWHVIFRMLPKHKPHPIKASVQINKIARAQGLTGKKTLNKSNGKQNWEPRPQQNNAIWKRLKFPLMERKLREQFSLPDLKLSPITPPFCLASYGRTHNNENVLYLPWNLQSHLQWVGSSIIFHINTPSSIIRVDSWLFSGCKRPLHISPQTYRNIARHWLNVTVNWMPLGRLEMKFPLKIV